MEEEEEEKKESRKCVCACPPEREREKLIAEREISGMICEDKCDRRLLITWQKGDKNNPSSSLKFGSVLLRHSATPSEKISPNLHVLFKKKKTLRTTLSHGLHAECLEVCSVQLRARRCLRGLRSLVEASAGRIWQLRDTNGGHRWDGSSSSGTDVEELLR